MPFAWHWLTKRRMLRDRRAMYFSLYCLEDTRSSRAPPSHKSMTRWTARSSSNTSFDRVQAESCKNRKEKGVGERGKEPIPEHAQTQICMICILKGSSLEHTWQRLLAEPADRGFAYLGCVAYIMQFKLKQASIAALATCLSTPAAPTPAAV
eukprot:scaffold55437_cov22-Tisochrysis_lutea.AAC.2